MADKKADQLWETSTHNANTINYNFYNGGGNERVDRKGSTILADGTIIRSTDAPKENGVGREICPELGPCGLPSSADELAREDADKQRDAGQTMAKQEKAGEFMFDIVSRKTEPSQGSKLDMKADVEFWALVDEGKIVPTQSGEWRVRSAGMGMENW